jgi:hypothetical protein
MSLLPPSLNPSSLYKEEAKRDATRIKIYNGVLTQIYNKIKAVAKVAGNEKALWYVVPEFLPGYPRFEPADAVIYIVWNLRNTGYFVEYTHPNFLYITWKAHDERYHQIESPWSQVLQSAKTNAIMHEPKQSIFIETPKETKNVEISKRKSILKKTVEFQPYVEIKPHVPVQSVPNTQMQNQMQTQNQGGRLPGQLSERHSSFV